jgi:hypothetical protein
MHQAAWWEGNGLRLCLCLCADSDVEDSSSSDVPDLEECNVEEELDEIVEGLTITHDDAVLVVSDTEWKIQAMEAVPLTCPILMIMKVPQRPLGKAALPTTSPSSMTRSTQVRQEYAGS